MPKKSKKHKDSFDFDSFEFIWYDSIDNLLFITNLSHEDTAFWISFKDNFVFIGIV